MIRKSLVVCLVVFLGYSFILLFVKKDKDAGQYQYQDNIIRGQHYLYRHDIPDAVMIGTSLSNKLPKDSLKGIYSLSFAGLNVFDGFHIILDRKTPPKTVFIETNYFFKPENKPFTSLFDSKLENKLKKDLVALQETNQPVNIFRYLLSSLFHSKKKAGIPKNEISVPQDVFSNLLKLQQVEYNKIDTNLIENSLNQLEQNINDINLRGSKVCFFEVPVSPELENLPLAQYVRTSIEKRFTGTRNVSFIKLPVGVNFTTVDGVHLDDYSAWRYTHYFNEEIEKLTLLASLHF
jgi:hypothetical protein